MHYGVISPPVPGHIHPFGALSRELIARGHQVSFVHMEDVRAWAVAQGTQFVPIGETDHPAGSLPDSLQQLGRLSGLAALRFTIRAVRKTTEMFCRDAPNAIRRAGIECLLADQTEPAGGTIAEYLGLPFVTVCNALLLNEEPGIPPPFTDWKYTDALWARARNRIGYQVAKTMMSPVTAIVDEYRKRWKLPAHRDSAASFSRLAQISQLPVGFDYPRRHLPPNFHYTGPLRDNAGGDAVFPWDRLDGRPLVYASLGTLQNGRERVFRIFAEACQSLPVQLLITHGGGLDAESAARLPGNPLVVSYAPQREVLKRASLTLTHAGLNTVLDSLSQGIPMVAVPITYEQPAIAERVRWSGAGEAVPFNALSVERLRAAVKRVLGSPRCREKAKEQAESISKAGGVKRAADLVEQTKKSTRG